MFLRHETEGKCSGGSGQLCWTPESTASLDIMEARGDAEAWRLEVERVAPSLKVTVRTETRDWRSNLEQIHQHRKNIESCMESARTGLGQLQKEIKETLEKVGSRERHINIQLESQLTNYRQIAQVTKDKLF